jgi:hypothetical protein
MSAPFLILHDESHYCCPSLLDLLVVQPVKFLSLVEGVGMAKLNFQFELRFLTWG